ncbi:MAG: hypothetical protein Unbinned4409contig1001_38 [Prokaryotic dsDNA virus sp.]|nr:MAG: hypothetical protein Unbinned4409contig1001_38 [Prokaryotic dsDNA virus sp.]|tara:strand:- start:18783 stop:20501 length:1719 start_codon:yes stop_codon:yes gene_type:complete
MSNGGPGFGAAIIPGLDISGGIPGVGTRRAQEQQQKGMLSSLMNVDMTGMSEQGIKYAQSMRDHLFNGITQGDENYTYEDFVKGVIGLQDFMIRDKKTYASNLTAAKPILDASVNDASYYDFNKRLETAAKTMSQPDVQRYATDFNFKLENPYPGTYFNPADMMLFPSDPNMAARTMTPINGMNILGAPLPDENSFQYDLQEIPTGNVLAYTKEKTEQNLLSLLNSVDNEADARNIIENHFSSFILGRGPGRKALAESLSGLGYEIKDLAGKLAAVMAENPEGLQAALQEQKVPYASSFTDNANVVYKEFEDYYMRLFKSQQREAAAQQVNKGKTADPKYNFEANLVTVPRTPSPSILKANLENTAMVNSLPGGAISGSPLDTQEADKLMTSISDNGFLQFNDRSEITMSAEEGTNLPDFKVTSFGMGGYDGNRYLILAGNEKRDVLQTVDVDPGPEADVIEIIPSPSGDAFDNKYVVRVGQEDQDLMNSFGFMSQEALNYFEAVGAKYLKQVDLSKVNFAVADQAEDNTRLGMAIVIRKMAHSVDSNGEQIFSDQEVAEAQNLIAQYSIIF